MSNCSRTRRQKSASVGDGHGGAFCGGDWMSFVNGQSPMALTARRKSRRSIGGLLEGRSLTLSEPELPRMIWSLFQAALIACVSQAHHLVRHRRRQSLQTLFLQRELTVPAN